MNGTASAPLLWLRSLAMALLIGALSSGTARAQGGNGLVAAKALYRDPISTVLRTLWWSGTPPRKNGECFILPILSAPER